jgi:hypothetical protein
MQGTWGGRQPPSCSYQEPKRSTAVGRLWRTPMLVLLATVALASGCGGSTGEETGRPGEVALDLEERNDANVAGARAVLRYEAQDRTHVIVDGLDAGERAGEGPNPVRLVRGSCAEPGRVAFQLTPLRGSTSETTIPIGIDELYEGDFAIEVLFSKSNSEALACGDVPDEPPS